MPATLADLDLPTFDYLDAELRGPRFEAAMAALAERGWLARLPLGVCTLDHKAGEFFLRSKQVAFPGMAIAELFDVREGPLHTEMTHNILHLEGQDHSRLRRLVGPAFTPRAADRYRPAMRGFLAELWAPLDGSADLVETLCAPYPALMIATVMGAPTADAARLAAWSDWIQRQFDPPSLMADRAQIEQAVEEFYAWAGELLARRRATPSDDLISTLIAAEEAGERLSDVELVNLVLNVLVGGVDTTNSQLAQALRLFAEHPEQWDALREDPAGRAPAAVEEVLRHAPITPFTARIVREELTYRDVVFPVGTIVMVAACTANREGVEGDFDIVAGRERRRSLTFGAGIHFCLGANLARAELEEALIFLAARVERWELDAAPAYASIQGIYGLDALHLRW
ncbi:MAG: cytochrome P450 [Solirubrobacterales bacterium]|nr:cytochrome P450 [Solirubrobacterales bacterium]